MDQKERFDLLCRAAIDAGAHRASVIPVDLVETDRSFRTLCEQNVCGCYGRNWMCPPDAGAIDELIPVLRSYPYILVYQSVGQLEDSYDFEGMAASAVKHCDLMYKVNEYMKKQEFGRILCLGAGGCRICPVCARQTNEPCRHPDRATPSLEAYGVNVSTLAKAAGMKYINGQNTVTYFGAVLFEL